MSHAAAALAWLICVLALAPARGVAASNAQAIKNPHGSTQGLFTTNPEYGLGVQVGNYGATGIVVQKVGFYDGAFNLGIGLAYASISAHADYLAFFTEDFRLMHLPRNPGYNYFRGQINPYAGGGLQVGRGFSIRVPVGLQYTMLRDPFTFYGGLVLMLGRFFTEDKFGPQLWFNVGARILL